jgi:HK97 gp10 family phage protein
MVDISVDVTFNGDLSGIAGIGSSLDELPGVLAVNAGNKLQDLAKGLVPVDTGRLRESIHMRAYQGQGFGAAFVAPNTEYAGYIEYGTGRRGEAGGGGKTYTLDHAGMAPRPYMHPAYNQTVAALKEQMREALAAALRGG